MNTIGNLTKVIDDVITKRTCSEMIWGEGIGGVLLLVDF